MVSSAEKVASCSKGWSFSWHVESCWSVSLRFWFMYEAVWFSGHKSTEHNSLSPEPEVKFGLTFLLSLHGNRRLIDRLFFKIKRTARMVNINRATPQLDRVAIVTYESCPLSMVANTATVIEEWEPVELVAVAETLGWLWMCLVTLVSVICLSSVELEYPDIADGEARRVKNTSVT